MSSAHLTEEQRTRLVAQLRRQLDYLNRLTSRIVKKRWPLEEMRPFIYRFGGWKSICGGVILVTCPGGTSRPCGSRP